MIRPGDRVYHYHGFFHDFTYYSGSTVGLVNYKDELETPVPEPADGAKSAFIDDAEFRSEWAGPGAGLRGGQDPRHRGASGRDPDHSFPHRGDQPAPLSFQQPALRIRRRPAACPPQCPRPPPPPPQAGRAVPALSPGRRSTTRRSPASPRCCAPGWITSGPQVKAFEARLSEYFGGRPVRAFNSGTCTMEIALRIAGVGPGDEVITTPLSWVATSNVVLEVGARPVFVDIDPVTRTSTSTGVEAAVTPADARDHPGRPRGPPGRPRPAERAREEARAARRRGRRAVLRQHMEGQADRLLRRLRLLQLPCEQEHHDRRGRLPRPERRARGASSPSSTACRASSGRGTTAWRSSWSGGSST